MKYTILDNNNLPIAFYSDDIHSVIPEDAIEISEDAWQECINNAGHRQIINGLAIEYVIQLTDEEIQIQKINEAKQYLKDTDYKMTTDYDGDITEVKKLRIDARELIRQHK